MKGLLLLLYELYVAASSVGDSKKTFNPDIT